MKAEEEMRQMAIVLMTSFVSLIRNQRIPLYLFYGYCWSRKRALFDSLLRRR